MADHALALEALRASAPQMAGAVHEVWVLDELPMGAVCSSVPYAVRAATMEPMTAAADAASAPGTATSLHFTGGRVRLLAARLPGDFQEAVLVSSRSRLADWLAPSAMRPVGPSSDWWVFESSPLDLHRGKLTLVTVSGGVPLELLFLGLPTDFETRTVVAAAEPRWSPPPIVAGAEAASAADGSSGSEPGDFSDSCEDRDK